MHSRTCDDVRMSWSQGYSLDSLLSSSSSLEDTVMNFHPSIRGQRSNNRTQRDEEASPRSTSQCANLSSAQATLAHRRHEAIKEAKLQFRCSRMECFTSDLAMLSPPPLNRRMAQLDVELEQIALSCTVCGCSEMTSIAY